ncbi:tetratricopeptide repeat protein [Nocardia sp. NPDC049220]|uniref:tetratricopeptide repeat protein n=1 Tax=Nocardia sp. NPDC049220 TaxID=3155273 RepID=UPI0033E7170F
MTEPIDPPTVAEVLRARLHWDIDPRRAGMLHTMLRGWPLSLRMTAKPPSTPVYTLLIPGTQPHDIDALPPTWTLTGEPTWPSDAEPASDHHARHANARPPTEIELVAMERRAEALWDAGDAAGAELWLRRAAAGGSAGAMTTLGTLLGADGRIGEGMRWLENSAARGSELAGQQLGLLHLERGNLDEAERWLRPAAELGLPEALCNMGVLANRRGRNDEAEHWYERAVRAGNPTAMRSLGLHVARRGAFDHAIDLLTEAVRRGRADAMAVLGALHLDRGDRIEGERWLRRGASAGDPDSMFHLALFLREQSTPFLAGDLADPEVRYAAATATDRTPAQQEAKQWLERAAALGHPQSLRLLHDL